MLAEVDPRDTKPFLHEEKPEIPLKVKTEAKVEAVPMTKAKTTFAQPTTGMSSHFLSTGAIEELSPTRGKQGELGK